MFDCQSCGACCCNTRDNIAEDYPWYVAIDDPRSKVLKKADLRKRYVVEDPDGHPHLRLDPSGRCAALRGKLGQRVHCAIYAHRPAPCRRVQPGDRDCLRAREERGLEV
jgi:Fe-S-cluster containining protein